MLVIASHLHVLRETLINVWRIFSDPPGGAVEHTAERLWLVQTSAHVLGKERVRVS